MLTSSLGRKVGKSHLSEEEIKKMAQAAWHRGWAVFKVEDIRDPWTRQVIVNEANRQYGGKHGS